MDKLYGGFCAFHNLGMHKDFLVFLRDALCESFSLHLKRGYEVLPLESPKFENGKWTSSFTLFIPFK